MYVLRMYSYAFVCFPQNWPFVGKRSQDKTKQNNAQQHTRRAQRPAQSGVHTAQHTLLRRGFPQPVYISASPSDTAYSALWLARHVKIYHEATTHRENRSKKANCKKSIRPKIEELILSSEERCPRDASPVSVVFGVDGGQVLLSRFAQLPFVATTTAAAESVIARGCCCCGLRFDRKRVTYFRKPKKKQVVCTCTPMHNIVY